MTALEAERPLPSGIITFMFSDIEGSTPLWEQNPAGMQNSLAQHNAIIHGAVAANGGQVFKTVGDEFCVVFVDPVAAVRAALAGQRGLKSAEWASTGPLKVRMGLHLGHVQAQDGDYTSHTVNRVARIMGAAHGGQILLSGEVVEVVRRTLPEGVSLKDLGQHRMKGMENEERIYQLVTPDLQQEFPPISTLPTLLSNLPTQTLTFVGREAEMAELIGLMGRENGRLITLLGPGGIGKTRLMLQTADTVTSDYPHGVWLVELAALTDSSLIPERVAAVLGVQEQPGRQMKETLVDYLRHKTLLLLLDNAEHVVTAVSELTSHLLQHCPKLEILVTSREALLIHGELTLPISSLKLPQADQTPEEIAASEGVKLFLERAKAVRPDFEVMPGNAAVIGEIVRRLDGIPLALELAAARLRMMTVEQINGRLDDRFRLLRGGSRTALPRQQTLQALIDWSWNLLEEKERLLFQRLAIFSGGWNLESAEAVAGFEPLDALDVFDGLEQLINKSLVTVHYPPEGQARYGMLENLHQYASAKLVAAGEEETLRERHVDYYISLIEEFSKSVLELDFRSWIDRFSVESDNLRAVLGSMKEVRPNLALRFTGKLLQYDTSWMSAREASGWLEPLIAEGRALLATNSAELDKADFIRALLGLGWLRVTYGQMASGLQVLDEVIDLARKFGEPSSQVVAISMKLQATITSGTPINFSEIEEMMTISRQKEMTFERFMALLAGGMAYIAAGDFEKGKAYQIELNQIVGDNLTGDLFAWNYQSQAFLAQAEGNHAEAERYLQLSLEAYTIAKNRRMSAFVRSDLAHMYRSQGRVAEAEGLYRRTILSWQEQGHQTAVAHQVECFAYLAMGRGDYGRAARLLGAAQATRQRLNEPSTSPQEIAEYEAAMAEMAEAMGEAERDRAMAEGGRLGLDEAVVLALE